MKQDKETDEDGKKRDVSMRRCKAGTKKKPGRPITSKPKFSNNKHLVLFNNIHKLIKQ